MEGRVGVGRREALGLGLVAGVAAITAAWWALALWPLDPEAPAWLARTRWVCFGALPQGLPSASGWISLIGEPVAMTILLLVVWGDTVRAGVRTLWHTSGGRLALGLAVGLALAGIGAVGNRVAQASAALPAPGSGEVVREDRPAPPLVLVDQTGRRFSLAETRGRPVLVTFAFGHCETVCPLVVRDVREAAAAVPEHAPVVVVVTLDPWRDLPARLPTIARDWGLERDAHVLGGSVAEVLAAIEPWGVTITRDERTGDITHPAIVFVLDREGRIAFTATGGRDVLAELLRQI
jgi:protein SCO1